MTIAKHTITIFNKYMVDSGGPFGGSADEVWNRTVVKYGQWEDRTDRNFDGNGITTIGKHIEVIIPKTANTAGKRFVKPIDWNELPADQKALTWTLQTEDYVFFGEVLELTGQFTIMEARKQHKNCIIKTVEDLSDQPVLPHWEIGGI